MITCIEREGEKQCSWWWNEQCHNSNVSTLTKTLCNGNLPRLVKEITNANSK